MQMITYTLYDRRTPVVASIMMKIFAKMWTMRNYENP